ncbi:MAG: hypothetical protein PHP65_00080 [Bacilli bacterium]|nr:hypothetical protein [Bacilli bacterium]
MPTRAKITCNDDKELRMILDTIYETKTQLQLAKYSLLLAHHILEITAIPINEVIMQGFFLNEQWQNKQARVHDVRVVGFQIHELAKKARDPLIQAAYRVVGHAVSSAHRIEHAMVASDYAILVMNALYPNDQLAVEKERQFQIHLMEQIS